MQKAVEAKLDTQKWEKQFEAKTRCRRCIALDEMLGEGNQKDIKKLLKLRKAIKAKRRKISAEWWRHESFLALLCGF